MATKLLRALMAFLSLGNTVIAVFINPPPTESQIGNPIYELGQEIKIRWNTNVEFTDLTMWQTDTANSKSKEYTWIASYQGIDPADGNSFSFWLFETGQTGSLFSSHTFNITDPTSTTRSATQSTRTKHPQTKTTSEATESTSEPASSSTIVDEVVDEVVDEPLSSGLSSGAIAGVAVGSVVGLLLIAGGVFMLWRRKNNKDVSGPTGEMGVLKYGAVEVPNDNEAHPVHGKWGMLPYRPTSYQPQTTPTNIELSDGHEG
ncbi:hypothetical protein ACHAPD_007629 [Fusarium lateritium]